VVKGDNYTILLYSKYNLLTLEAIVVLIELLDNPINIKYKLEKRVLSKASMNYYQKHRSSNITLRKFYQEIRKAKTWMAGNIIGH
jgi:hypothetical protein